MRSNSISLGFDDYELKPAPLTPVFMAWCLPYARTGTLCVGQTQKGAFLYKLYGVEFKAGK